MLLSVVFSKPVSNIEEILEKPYKRVKIKVNPSSIGLSYFAEFFTEKQSFHKTFSKDELDSFIKQHAGTTFKNCVQLYTDREITVLANKKGKITTLERSRTPDSSATPDAMTSPDRHIKNYIIREGSPVPFLISLGVMTPDGKVIKSRYDKFKQINRFLEYIDDILPSVVEQKKTENTPLYILDFGCGKSYLTFAVHYFLTQIKKINCKITGLDLKEDVIEHCNKLVKEFKCEGLSFKTGDIAEYSEEKINPDIIITLHACDTATDFALKYAVSKNAKAILSVPCCQHEVKSQLDKNKAELLKKDDSILSPVLKHGLIRERIAALITDSLRAEYLESCGYKVDVMEFIDMSHTPKNILLRAIKKRSSGATGTDSGAACESTDTDSREISKPKLIDYLKIDPQIWK